MSGRIGTISFSGFTRRYADWIAEETGLSVCDLREIRNIDIEDPYLLVGVPVHGQELCEIRKIRKLIREKDPEKQLILYATGLRCDDENVKENILKYNFNDLRPDAFFYFTGGLDKDRLATNDRMFLRLQQMMISRHPDCTESDEELLFRMKNGGDYTDRQQISPLIDYLNRF